MLKKLKNLIKTHQIWEIIKTTPHEVAIKKTENAGLLKEENCLSCSQDLDYINGHIHQLDMKCDVLCKLNRVKSLSRSRLQ